MIQHYSHLVGAPIIGQHGNHVIARVKDAIIDPERGTVIAIRVDRKNRLISPVDILSWEIPLQVIDDSVLLNQDELLRVKQIIEKKMYLIKKRVETTLGEFVGYVNDFSFDTHTGALHQISAAQRFLGFYHDNRLISAKNIVEITPAAVIVKETSKKVPVQWKKGLKLETC